MVSTTKNLQAARSGIALKMIMQSCVHSAFSAMPLSRRDHVTTFVHTKAVGALCGVLFAIVLAGCSTGGGLTGSRGENPTPSPSNTPAGLTIYLETMRDLVEGDPVTQAEVFADANQALEWAPTTTNRLRYALALAVPGHPSSDPIEAASILNELLASNDALLPDERMLATIHLKEVESRLVLNRETQRLQQAADNNLERQVAESARRLRVTAEENQRLRQQLREAEDKLEAITAIERSIQEREDGGDSP